MHSALTAMQCLVSVIPFSISVHGLPRRANVASEKKFFWGVQGFWPMHRGVNWNPVQDMT